MKEESKIRTISLTDPAFKIVAWVLAFLCISLVILSNYEYLSSLTWAKFSRDSVILLIKVVFLVSFLFFMEFTEKILNKIEIKKSSKWYLIRVVFNAKKEAKDPNEPEHYLA